MKKQVLTTITALAFLTTSAGMAYATSIDLTGTIRDFKNTHLDFERDIIGLEEGIVEEGLGQNGKPVFADPAGANTDSSSVTTEENFYQWYNDVDDVNMSTPHTITLDKSTDSNVYKYTNNSFFPINKDLFGNTDGYDKNYHFTYEIHSSFTYQKDDFFKFTGDDDLWVFIDDKLAVDIGGVHPAVTKSVNFSSLDLTIGNNYDFDLFFAERNTTESNFTIETSIQFNPVPEPATMLLFGTGLASLAGVARRKRKK